MTDFQLHIQMALNTEETGEDLVDVARAAHEAEQQLAEIERLVVRAGIPSLDAFVDGLRALRG
jgi:hypothetical protein